ncbi:MAG: BON domain-containing protein, partial [Natronohydrobacter sp.]|nr:BON domain-containing protein [Natronohydrobacter sp.]
MLRLVLICLLCLLAAPPAQTQTNDGLGLTDLPIGVQTGASDDLRILRRLEELLTELRGYEHVTVEVRGGVVIFTGRTVEAEKQEALNQIAARIDGVVAVENRVEVSLDVAERVAPVAERLWRRALAGINAAPVLLVAALTGLALTWAGFQIARLHWPWDRIAPNEFMADVLRQIIRLIAI